MKTADYESFAQTLSVVAATLNEPMDATRIDGFWFALKDQFVDADDFKASAKAVLSKKVYKLQPHDFLEGRPEPELLAAIDAWDSVLVGIQAGKQPADDATRKTLRLMGGWNVAMSSWKDSELEWHRKHFMELFKVAATSPYKQLESGAPPPLMLPDKRMK